MAKPDPTRVLFKRYKAELSTLYRKQVREREAVIRRIMDQQGVDEEAAAEIDETENGPLIHDGRAIHLIIRKYWFEVDQLKKKARSSPTEAGWSP